MVTSLTSPESDDAADGIVGRYAYGNSIAGYNLDAKAAHTTAELGKNLMSGVALDAI